MRNKPKYKGMIVKTNLLLFYTFVRILCISATTMNVQNRSMQCK